MKTWPLAVLVSAGVLFACAANPGPPSPAPFDATGTYDFSTYVEGYTVNGTLTVTEGPNGLRGTVSTDMTEPLALNTVTVDGRTVTGSGSTPEGTFSITMTVEEDGVLTGGWTLGTLGGTVQGRKRGA